METKKKEDTFNFCCKPQLDRKDFEEDYLKVLLEGFVVDFEWANPQAENTALHSLTDGFLKHTQRKLNEWKESLLKLKAMIEEFNSTIELLNSRVRVVDTNCQQFKELQQLQTEMLCQKTRIAKEVEKYIRVIDTVKLYDESRDLRRELVEKLKTRYDVYFFREHGSYFDWKL